MKRLGVLTDHGESFVPSNPDFSAFFGAVEREGVHVEALTDDALENGLGGFEVVLLGAPTKPLPGRIIERLRTWLAAGGRLLLTGGAGGDAPPGGQTNLSEVIPGLSFGNDVVGFSTNMYGYENLVFWCAGADLAPRLRGYSFPFVTGCTLRLAPSFTPRVAIARTEPGDGPATVFRAPLLEDADTLTSASTDDTPLAAPIYLELSSDFAAGTDGRGLIIVSGSTLSFHDEYLRPFTFSYQPGYGRRFVDHLLWRLFHDGFTAELIRRLKEPQRHRLLQGYPMPKLMLPQPPLGPDLCPRPPRTTSQRGDNDRGLAHPGQHRSCIVGVLPHAFCNPTVRGCGFCTFPQEKLSRDRLPTITRAVGASIAAYRERVLAGARQKTPALYFGGGTANLTPPALFAELCREIGQTFDTDGSEITLEGVPRYFGIEDRALLHVLREAFPTAHWRISMGVQTFHREQLRRMGRSGFGDRREIEVLVSDAQTLGFSVSCDLLINLPGQTLGEMIDDLEIAARAGFDQICVYHLVMFDGLGTAWSEDKSLLALMNDNPAAFANQRRCRKRLYELGFTQTTLTNFERRASPRPRFQYEPLGFQPDRHDLLGFGPAAITLASEASFQHGWKTVRAQETDPYLRGEERGLFFGEDDMKLLFLTRSIAGLSIDAERYRALFGHDVFDDYGGELEALITRGLLRERPGTLALTPEGMFYADSIAGLLAWRRVQILRDRVAAGPLRGYRGRPSPVVRFHDPNLSSYGDMG